MISNALDYSNNLLSWLHIKGSRKIVAGCCKFQRYAEKEDTSRSMGARTDGIQSENRFSGMIRFRVKPVSGERMLEMLDCYLDDHYNLFIWSYCLRCEQRIPIETAENFYIKHPFSRQQFPSSSRRINYGVRRS